MDKRVESGFNIARGISRRKVLQFLGASAAGAMFSREGAVAADPSSTSSIKAKDSLTVFAFLRAPMIRDFVDLDAYDLAVPHLTDVGYFGIPLDSDGELIRGQEFHLLGNKKVADVLTRTQNAGVRKILTITQFDASSIRNFFDGDQQAQKRSVESITSDVSFFGFSGVSVDFEALGDFNPLRRNRFVLWIEQLNYQLKVNDPNAVLSVCVHPLTAASSMLWDLRYLSEKADQIFNMAYEYYGPHSGGINPTAPLYGAATGAYWYDVDTSVRQFSELMPIERIILGLPLYGNRGVVTEPKMKATILDGGGYATYANAQVFRRRYQNTPGSGYIEDYSPLARTEYQAIPRGDGTWEMLVVGGSKFLEDRLKYVEEKKLGGIGFWALDHMTYNVQDQRFWQVLASHKK